MTRSRPRSSKRAPMAVEMGDEFGRREHRIMPQPARHRAGMAGLADAFDDAVADVAADARDDADRQIARHQHRALLDVQFEPRGECFRVEPAARPFSTRSTSTPTSRMHSPSVRSASVAFAARSVGRQFAEQRARSHIGLAEAGALFAAQGRKSSWCGVARKPSSLRPRKHDQARRPRRRRRRSCRPAAPNRDASRRPGTADRRFGAVRGSRPGWRRRRARSASRARAPWRRRCRAPRSRPRRSWRA